MVIWKIVTLANPITARQRTKLISNGVRHLYRITSCGNGSRNLVFFLNNTKLFSNRLMLALNKKNDQMSTVVVNPRADMESTLFLIVHDTYDV